MDPISTLALVAAFLAPAPLTRRPEWVVSAESVKVPGVLPLETDHLLLATPAPTDELLAPVVLSIRPDRKMTLQSEMLSYEALADGWDGPGSAAPSPASIEAANRFIEAFPAGLPLPKPMLSSVGHLGFYWDLVGGYADLSFEESGTASFFSRSLAGVEHFFDDLTAEQLTREWAFASLGELSAPALQAA